jgi:hypothetical protein
MSLIASFAFSPFAIILAIAQNIIYEKNSFFAVVGSCGSVAIAKAVVFHSLRVFVFPK